MLYKLTCKDKADLTFIHYTWSFRSEANVIEKIVRKYGWEVLDIEVCSLFSFLIGRFFGTSGSATTVSIESLILFYRQFAMMQKNGVNLKVSLELCAESSSDKRMRYVCECILRDVKNGKPLAEATAAFPFVFDRMSSAMINAGIKSNSLGDTLSGLAASSELAYELDKKLNNASIYPMIALTISAVVLVIFSFFVIPKFMPLYSAIPGGMPFVTSLLVDLSNFMTGHPWVMLIILGIPIVVFKKKRDIARSKLVQRLFHSLPGIRVLTKNVYMSRYLHMLGQLSDAGLPILQQIRILEEASNVKMYKDAWHSVGEGIENGISLSDSLAANSHVLPAMVIGNIKAAEASGDVARAANFLADFYTREVRLGVANVQVLIEPIFIVIIASFVGFLLFCMFMPLFDITKLIA